MGNDNFFFLKKNLNQKMAKQPPKYFSVIDYNKLSSKIGSASTHTQPVMGVVNKDTGKFRVVHRDYHWNASKRTPDFIQGQTLDRIVVLSKRKDGSMYVFVRVASTSMKERGCDDCIGPHRTTNTRCSVTLEIKTPLQNPRAYDENQFKNVKTNKKLAGKWVIIPDVFYKRRSTYRAIMRRI